MPIRDCRKHLYPPAFEWRVIREEVVARDDNRCKWCGMPNHIWIARSGRNSDVWFRMMGVNTRGEAEDAVISWGSDPRSEWKPVRIVLTVAHIDRDPRNNGVPGKRPNLAALCQRCHLNHDRETHIVNAARTRDGRKGPRLFPFDPPDGEK